MWLGFSERLACCRARCTAPLLGVLHSANIMCRRNAQTETHTGCASTHVDNDNDDNNNKNNRHDDDDDDGDDGGDNLLIPRTGR